MKGSLKFKLVLSLVFSGACAGYFDPSVLADTQPSGTDAAPAKLESAPTTSANLLPDTPGVRLAKQELPELTAVLERLKSRAPAQFDKAVKDLDRAAKRLDTMKRREPDRHEDAMAEWRLHAQLDLLKAKHKAKPSKASEAAIELQQKAIKTMRTGQIEKELAFLASREKLLNERIQQAKQALERGEQRRLQLQAELEKFTVKSSRTKSNEESKHSSDKPENESRE